MSMRCLMAKAEAEKLDINRVGNHLIKQIKMRTELTKSPPLFEKRVVATLSEIELENVNGGSTPVQLAAAAAALAYAGYKFGHWVYDVTH
jgi:lactobin A/cerein 7B family class IIb bacteriocin